MSPRNKRNKVAYDNEMRKIWPMQAAIFHHVSAPPAPGALASLDAILSDEVNVVVVPRALPGEVARGLEQAALGDLTEIEQETADGQADLDGLLSGLPPGPARSWLRRDAEALLARFAALASRPRFLVSLGLILDDQCRKFHTDSVALRLLVTYAGPGTEWAPDGAVRRGALRAPAGCPDEANAAIVPDPSLVRRAGAGDVVLLKGDRWPGGEGRGAVHRSPPLGRSGARRLVLKATAFAGGSTWGS